MKKILFLIFTGIAIFARADVFLLGPGGGERGGQPSAVLNPLELWDEPIVINGKKNSLGVSLIGKDLKTCFAMLRKMYPSAKFAFNAESILFEVKEGNEKRRVFLVETGKGPYPVVQFSMSLNDIPEECMWPSQLPLPPSSTPSGSMEFPDRKSVYGNFSSHLSPSLVLSSISAELSARGWIPLGGEAKKGVGLSGRGDFFIKYNPTQVTIVSFENSEEGITKGAIYMKTIKKDK